MFDKFCENLIKECECGAGCKLSPGLLNAVDRVRNSMSDPDAPKYSIKKICGGCGFFILKYKGKYPARCPHCQTTLDYKGPISMDDKDMEVSSPAVSIKGDVDPVNSPTYKDVEGRKELLDK